MNTTAQWTVAVVAILLSASCASSPSTETPSRLPPSPVPVQATDIFPKPEGLETQVAFWRKVYALWSLRQVALHDAEHLDLVYEVLDLPAAASDDYNAGQRDFVRERREVLRARLRELERKVLDGARLDAVETALAARIVASSGRSGLFGASERVRSQRGLRERFRRGLEISGRYDTVFREIFRQAGLPEDFSYLPHVESSFQANARSSAGAVGLWQFTRAAARTYMNTHPALDERLDPIASARGAARYLAHAYRTLGDWPLAVTSYNHGIGGMQRAKEAFGTDFVRVVHEYEHPSFGFASRNFYAEFLAAREIARQPARFFPEGVRYEAALDWDRVVLERRTPASQLAAEYDVGIGELAALNAAWTPAVRRGRVALPAGTEVWLPPGTLQRIAQRDPMARRVLALAENDSDQPNRRK